MSKLQLDETLKMISDVINNSSDDHDYGILSNEELNGRIQSYHDLCIGNKINMKNAFDIDMVGYFSTWLDKQTNHISTSSFQEISDYLETTRKIYGYRIDNLDEFAIKLIEVVNAGHLKKDILKSGENVLYQYNPRPKGLKLTLSTADKLVSKYPETVIDPRVKFEMTNFDYKKVLHMSRPSKNILMMYSNYSFKQEIMKYNVKQIVVDDDDDKNNDNNTKNVDKNNDNEDKYKDNEDNNKDNDAKIVVDKNNVNGDYNVKNDNGIYDINNDDDKNDDNDVISNNDNEENDDDNNENDDDYDENDKNDYDTDENDYDSDENDYDSDENDYDRDENDDDNDENDYCDNDNMDYKQELPDLNEMDNRILCYDFDNFITEYDKHTEKSALHSIEMNFTSDIITPKTSICNENDNDLDHHNEIGSLHSNDNGQPENDDIVECIDNVNNDYSFFNPNLLSNWKGPKEWKSQAMISALKLNKPSHRKLYRRPILAFDDTIDEKITQNKHENYEHATLNKHNIEDDEYIQVEWLKWNEIHDKLNENILRKEVSQSINKWNMYNNLLQDHNFKIIYTYVNLSYEKVKPDWLLSITKVGEKVDGEKIVVKNKKSKKSSYKNQGKNHKVNEKNPEDKYNDIDDIQSNISKQDNNNKVKEQTPEDKYSDIDDIQSDITKQDYFETNLDTKDGSNDDETDNDYYDDNDDTDDICSDNNDDNDNSKVKEAKKKNKKEKLDIAELKKEMANIIDQECINTESDDEWTSSLSFVDLLIKMRLVERKNLSVALIYVGLLHLANEKCLKLIQKPSDVNEIQEIFIAKPINKK